MDYSISAEKIKEFCSREIYPLVVEETGSTNTDAKALAASGAPEGTLIVAARQTAGRGRRGRSFYSPEGTGLYMSLILRPAGKTADAVKLTCAAAVAVAESLEDVCGKKAGIKWVNDLFLDGKKICGILCECGFAPDVGIDWIVAGIGINVISPAGGFPEEIQDIAGAVFTPEEQPCHHIRARLAGKIAEKFFEFYRGEDFFEAYRSRLTMLGKSITVHSPRESYSAVAIDIDRDFGLIVEGERYGRETLSTGEVSIRPRSGG